MSTTLLVLILLLILLPVGGHPHWWGHPYGYWPSGVLGAIVLVLIVLALTGRL